MYFPIPLLIEHSARKTDLSRSIKFNRPGEGRDESVADSTAVASAIGSARPTAATGGLKVLAREPSFGT